MTWLTLGASAIAFSVAAQNRQLPPPSASTPVSPQTQVAHGEDAEFLLDALRSSKAEMQMGELAQQRSKNAAVQQFGEKLRADHAKAADEIETLLEPLNMNVPVEPSTEQQSHYAALAKLKRFQYIPSNPNFFVGFGSKRDADRVADAFVQEHSQADRGFYRATKRRPGLGHAEVQRVVNLLSH